MNRDLERLQNAVQNARIKIQMIAHTKDEHEFRAAVQRVLAEAQTLVDACHSAQSSSHNREIAKRAEDWCPSRPFMPPGPGNGEA